MPMPGCTELRESSSPVPAQMMFGSLGAIARSPMDAMGARSQSGKKLVPALMVFQIPPVAPAT
jgi:hypothetical protein